MCQQPAIRLATIDDAGAISALIVPVATTFIAHEFSATGRRNLLTSMEPEAIRGYFEAGYRYHVAEVEGHVVGVVGVRDNSHVYHLFVAEQHQRRGLAKTLWKVARDACLETGNPGRFTVYSSKHALGVYRTFGFVESGPAEIKDDITATPMAYVAAVGLRISTKRLELVAGTTEMLQAEIRHTGELGNLLLAAVPDNWPPELWDDEPKKYCLEGLSKDPEAVGWYHWYMLGPRTDLGWRECLGAAGFTGRPDADGAVLLGYGLLEQFRLQGFATEAVGRLVEWAFGSDDVSRIVADTFPHLHASIRVLEKNGFHAAGSGSDEGTIRYELLKT